MRFEGRHQQLPADEMFWPVPDAEPDESNATEPRLHAPTVLKLVRSVNQSQQRRKHLCHLQQEVETQRITTGYQSPMEKRHGCLENHRVNIHSLLHPKKAANCEVTKIEARLFQDSRQDI